MPQAALRPLLPLAVGVLLGGAGVVLFRDSLPGAEGSPEQRAARLEVELKQARNRIAAMEAADPDGRWRPRTTAADRAREVIADIRAGRPVSPDDLLRAGQPLLRDLAPIFDRIRVRVMQDWIDATSGELARRYRLDARQQEALREWFEHKAEEDAKRWSDLVGREGTTLVDLAREAARARPDEGLDAFMEGMLSGDDLASFRAERMAERAQRVQEEADRRVQRLDEIVDLDDVQRDQVFGIVARGSPDFDPAMQLEGIGGEIAATPGGDPREAMLSVLRQDQRAAFDAEMERRRQEAEKEMGKVGLSLPPNWDMFDDF